MRHGQGSFLHGNTVGQGSITVTGKGFFRAREYFRVFYGIDCRLSGVCVPFYGDVMLGPCVLGVSCEVGRKNVEMIISFPLAHIGFDLTGVGAMQEDLRVGCWLDGSDSPESAG